MSSIPPKMKPLKKVQHWIIKGKMNGSAVLPPKNGLVTPSEERYNNERQPLSRKPSWAEDDRPAPKKNKRGRPPSNQSRPSFLSDAVAEKQRPGESIVATAMAAAKGSRRNSIRAQNGTSPNKNGTSYGPDEVLYCICRKPYDIPRFMIACDRCDQWFHGECIGISEKEGEFIDLYFCDDCSKATGKTTSWKPKCSNPACPKAARIGSHQGHVSKYCSNTCGMQVARARLELADMKRKAGGCATATDITDIVARREKKARLESLSDKDDQKRLLRLREAKQRMKAEIVTADRKLVFLKTLIQSQNKEVCGFDTRLLWPDDVWHCVCDDFQRLPESDGTSLSVITKFSTPKMQQEFSICSEARCNRHGGWQNLKLQEFEQDRSSLFNSLATFVRQRKQIKARIRRRREGALEDTAEWLAHATITHTNFKR
ncbi:hypothetical protein BDA99DRAFT_516109 [Phascolomyces articulosus]|uniref:PHD-type domain-containing protein n=1 Tax=Phascolomyces articulosus TaxID=60185 RepID=A0AAD5PDR8_9FUNG|nr:hypothetical protein BDA99DRAFT_516109 [Phascolomyces articulosus]